MGARDLLRYYMHRGPSAFRIELAGFLGARDAARLEHDSGPGISGDGGRGLIVDLSFVDGADEGGLDLLRRWAKQGALFVAARGAGRRLAESIAGNLVPEGTEPRGATWESTWEPWFNWDAHPL